MTITKRLILIVLLFPLVAGALAWAGEPPKRVLILDSFGRDVAPISKVISTFRTELSLRSPWPIDLYEVSLEMARFAQPEQERPFVNFLKERFSSQPLDLVVSVAGPAAVSFERNGAYLFPGAPLLVTGTATRIVQDRNLSSNMAAVCLDIDPKAFVTSFLQLRPETDDITVILGTTPLEMYRKVDCERQFAEFSHRIQFHFVTHLSLDQIESRVSRLPPKASVFYIIMLVDAAGTPFDSGYAVERICQAANVPVFSVHESYLGRGPVGGRHIPEREAGSRAAESALRILT